jgi:hypothetical protein
MLTEAAKEKISKDKIASGIRICEEAMAKAEKYERLKENKDWLGYLDDLKILAGLHENEIKMGQSMLIDAPNTGYVKHDDFEKEVYVSSKKDWTDFIIRHQIQKQEAENWIKEPERILTMATMARERLPILKEKLAEIERGAEVSGKS